jgi:hypothetical protein
VSGGIEIKTDSLYNMCFGAVQTAPSAVCQNGVMDYVLHPVEQSKADVWKA